MLNFFYKTYPVKFQQFCQAFFLFIFTMVFTINLAAAGETSTESLITANTSLSNQAALKFKHLLTADGLSQNNVFDITQDNDGFIWIATEDGLNRYDGKNFVHYRRKLGDPTSIANNFIRKVFVDQSGVLWVGTQKGLSKYNKQFDNFENHYHQKGNSETLIDNFIWDIYQDKKNNIWVSTENGIQKYNKENNSFTKIRIHGFEDKIKAIKTIYQDLKGNFWLGSYDNGIFLVNEDLNYSESLQKENNKWHITIPANSLFEMKEINGEYWLATDDGVYVLDENYNLNDKYHTSHPTNKIISDKVRSIVKADDSTVWLGTEDGLNIIDLNSKAITTYQNNQESSSLSKNKILKIIKDVTGKIWLTTHGRGVNVFLNASLNFKHYSNGVLNGSIDLLTESTDGKVWFYSENLGLNYLNSEVSGNYIDALKGKQIYQLKSDNKNNLWINTYSHVNSINNSGELFTYNVYSKETKKIKGWETKSFYDQKYPFQVFKNNIWFIDVKGMLVSYKISTNEFNRYQARDNQRLTTLQIDNENSILWAISSKNQLISFNLSTSLYSKENFNYHDIKGIRNLTTIEINNIKSSNSWVWLTSKQGVLLYNREKKTTTYYNENNKLLNNSIESILLDNKENAWISANGAISLINPTTQHVRNFSKDFHLSNIEFIERSSLKTSNNEFFFGGSNGVHKFSPQKAIQIIQGLNPPQLTNLLIANKKISVQEAPISENKFLLSRQLSQLSLLTLKHEQSPFTIEFISPNAKYPDQISYRYRLLNLETDWIDAGKNNYRATYTNLSAGDYIFEVEVYDLLDTVPSKKSTLNIHILAPWWLSKTAIIAYTLLCFLLIGYVIQQMRHKRLFHLQIQKSEERLKLSLWGSGDEMWDWNIITGKIYRSNIWGILEFPQDGKRNVGSDKTNINEHDIARVRDAINDHFDNDTDHFEATYRVKNKDDKWIWVLDRGKIVERDEKGTPTRMTGTLKDISRIKKADERLKLFAKCIENISDAVVIYDRAFNIVDVNKSYQRITQKTRKEMLGITLDFAQYPKSFTKNVKKHLITKGSWHDEIESKRDNGEKYLTDLNIDVILDENKSISHFVGVFSDITKRKETEEELRKLANSDTLTGLPNRSYFQANQTLLVDKKAPHALLVFDLDNFKKINDSMGHEVGDVLLCQVAKRMQAVGRKQDTVYRLGGDEFSIIIENTNDIHTITSIAKDVLTTIAQPLKLRNQEVVLFSSLGIVLYPEDGISPQELLKNADTAMYHAKNNGGNKYQFFNDSMNKAAVKRLQIESLIRHGLKEDSFSVFYQPKIEISTGKVAGMEALVRFETPKKGIISPITFIPISEETGQIIDIGEIVLRKSCFATKKWVDAGLFNGRVAVNLSAVQFTQPNLVGMIADILKESQLPAKYLELEITEGTVMDSPQKAIDIMLQIRAMGIHLSLDDFGTGYSSLAYLKKFPLNTLKIDKAFVDDIEESEQGRNMVATIVTIAHNLGMQVVAEGVETNNQLSFLSGLRCEQLQGYLYSKALPEGDFQKYLLSYQITKASTNFGKTSF